jgi:hypothetical protein
VGTLEGLDEAVHGALASRTRSMLPAFPTVKPAQKLMTVPTAG